MQSLRALFLAVLLLGLLPTACATDDDVSVRDGWIRATAPGQQVAAAYLAIESRAGATLTGATTDLADRVEIHSMTMENEVMKMRRLTTLELPAGELVRLQPGGMHLMLLGLKSQLVAGMRGTLELRFKNRDGTTRTHTLTLPVRAAADAS